jgi:hypothetical protein
MAQTTGIITVGTPYGGKSNIGESERMHINKVKLHYPFAALILLSKVEELQSSRPGLFHLTVTRLPSGGVSRFRCQNKTKNSALLIQRGIWA